MLNAPQIRAARAILNWSQTTLAQASGISLATIRKIETEAISPRNTTMDALFKALSHMGIEFVEPDGARRRPSGLFVFEGKNGGREFFKDLKQSASKAGGEIFIVTPTPGAFAKYCGLDDILQLDSLIDVNNTVEIRCLLTHAQEVPFSTPRFSFRTISRNFVNPVPFCTYGLKYALAMPETDPYSKVIVLESTKMAHLGREHFLSLWDKAMPSIYTETHLAQTA